MSGRHIPPGDVGPYHLSSGHVYDVPGGQLWSEKCERIAYVSPGAMSSPHRLCIGVHALISTLAMQISLSMTRRATFSTMLPR